MSAARVSPRTPAEPCGRATWAKLRSTTGWSSPRDSGIGDMAVLAPRSAQRTQLLALPRMPRRLIAPPSTRSISAPTWAGPESAENRSTLSSERRTARRTNRPSANGSKARAGLLSAKPDSGAVVTLRRFREGAHASASSTARKTARRGLLRTGIERSPSRSAAGAMLAWASTATSMSSARPRTCRATRSR